MHSPREMAQGGSTCICPFLLARHPYNLLQQLTYAEDYVALVWGEPIGCVLLAHRNADGQTQHVVASYRPRTALDGFSRILREKFAGLPYADQFASATDE